MMEIIRLTLSRLKGWLHAKPVGRCPCGGSIYRHDPFESDAYTECAACHRGSFER